MSGINSLSGLNKVNVDFRPAIQEDAQKPENTNQLLPDAEAVPGEAPLGSLEKTGLRGCDSPDNLVK